MRLRRLVLFLFMLGLAPAAHAGEPCELRLLPTSELIAYLDTLAEQGVLTAKAISTFTENLNLGVIVNPISASTSSAARVHRDVLETFLNSEVNLAELTTWAREHTEAQRQQQSSRSQTSEDTRGLVYDLFRVVEADYANWQEVPRFEVMERPATQRMWKRYMRSQPFVGAQPDAPVEDVTLWSALEFANRVSRAMDLPPYYNLENLHWEDGTSAEAGTLAAVWKQMTVEIGGPGFRLVRASEFAIMTKLSSPLNPKLQDVFTAVWLDPYHQFCGTTSSGQSNCTTKVLGVSQDNMRVSGIQLARTLSEDEGP